VPFLLDADDLGWNPAVSRRRSGISVHAIGRRATLFKCSNVANDRGVLDEGASSAGLGSICRSQGSVDLCREGAGDVRIIQRATLSIGGLALVASLLLAVLPTRGEALISFVPPGEETYGDVNCGTVVSATKWSNSDGCEAPLLIRFGWMFIAFLTAVVFGGVGLVLLFLQARRGG